MRIDGHIYLSIDLLRRFDVITARVKVVFHLVNECNCIVGFIEAPNLGRRVVFQNKLMLCVMRGTSGHCTKGEREHQP